MGDTLYGTYTPDEIETILAHELGHHVNRDIPLGIAFQTVLTLLGLYLAHLALLAGVQAFGFNGAGDVAAFPLFVAVMGIFGLVTMPIGYPSWSHNGQYLYFDTTLTDDPAFFRVGISDHKLERLVSLKGLQRFWGQFGSWTGLAPDDSLLLIRDTSSQEIYALDWQQP